MISLDQIQVLEQKIESAVAEIAQLRAENDALRSKCAELTNALSAKTEQLSAFQTDQSKIEFRIKKALEQLENIPARSGESSQVEFANESSTASEENSAFETESKDCPEAVDNGQPDANPDLSTYESKDESSDTEQETADNEQAEESKYEDDEQPKSYDDVSNEEATAESSDEDQVNSESDGTDFEIEGEKQGEEEEEASSEEQEQPVPQDSEKSDEAFSKEAILFRQMINKGWKIEDIAHTLKRPIEEIEAILRSAQDSQRSQSEESEASQSEAKPIFDIV